MEKREQGGKLGRKRWLEGDEEGRGIGKNGITESSGTGE